MFKRLIIVILACILLFSSFNVGYDKPVNSDIQPNEPEDEVYSTNDEDSNEPSSVMNQQNDPENEISTTTDKNYPDLNNIDFPGDVPNDLIDSAVINTLEEDRYLQNFNEINGFFTSNWGQVGNDSVRYYIQGGGVWFLDDSVVFEIFEESEESMLPMNSFDLHPFDFDAHLDEDIPPSSVVIKLNFEGANKITPQGKGRLSHNSNFFYGNDSSKWCTDVPNYQEVYYENLYPNIDLRYYTTDVGLKYDFIVRPGGDINQIRMLYEGINKLEINCDGDLIIKTDVIDIVDGNLFIYQDYEGKRHSIEGKFIFFDEFEFGFALNGYYRSDVTIVIDPTLIYSTYVGGLNDDFARGVATDSKGCAYITGFSNSSNFPTTPGVYQSDYNGSYPSDNVIVCKLNKNGTQLNYSTFIGYGYTDRGGSITVDESGCAYITGLATSDFPTTKGAYDTSCNDFTNQPGPHDVFVLKLNHNGSSLIFSTYIGGLSQDFSSAIALDSAGNIYIGGDTNSRNFPTTTGAYDTTHNGLFDCFVSKFNQNGSKLIYSTYVGGSTGFDHILDITVDSYDEVYATGETFSSDFPTTPNAYDKTISGKSDAFVFKLNKKGTNIVYSTFIGGNGREISVDIEIDSMKNVFITGSTASTNYPTTPGTYNKSKSGGGGLILTKLNQNCSELIYSACLGGTSAGWGQGLNIDDDGNAYVSGSTASSNFPTTVDAYDKTFNGKVDIIFLKLNSNASELLYSTYIGGTGIDLCQRSATNYNGKFIIVGETDSPAFPTTTGAYDLSFNGGRNDCFVLKLDMNATSTYPSITSFKATTAPEGSDVIFSVNVTGFANDKLNYSFDFQNDGLFDLVTTNNTASYIWGDDYNGIALVRVSGGNQSIEANTTVTVTNAPPLIKPFGPVSVDEGCAFEVSANVTDPGSDDLKFKWHLENGPTFTKMCYNNGTSLDPYPSPEGTFPFNVNDTISHTYGDNGVYNLTLTVEDDDGLNATHDTTVIVRNIAPDVDIKVLTNEVNISFRIAGEKWHDVLIHIYTNDSLIVNRTLVRYPGSPNDQTFDLFNFTIDTSKTYTAVLTYTPEDDPVNGQPNGANPCWIIFKFSDNNTVKLHHTFNVKHPDTYVWKVNLTDTILSHGLTFIATASDTGADDLTFKWIFDDGTSITNHYPNSGGTFPVNITDIVTYGYLTNGAYTFTLIVEDDDGGIFTITKSIDVYKISRFIK
ncbi:MAG: SBBP repeat-containing protein [Thermoplasmata archaeon]|nr:MAG: SBBP repeat-containing protein [Thermoplasmata archaeon]